MKRTVRATYPLEIKVFILCIFFVLACFLSHRMLDVRFGHPEHKESIYPVMFLVGLASVIVLLILWEEILFPIKMRLSLGSLKVRNSRKKLRIQIILYLCIPAIFSYIYFNYDVNHFQFFIWLATCMIIPLAQKIFSGIKNYNDFLILTSTEIEYKNNKKEGKILMENVKFIQLYLNEDNFHKLRIGLDNSEVIIDLDEMELEAYYDIINKFVNRTYKNILKN